MLESVIEKMLEMNIDLGLVFTMPILFVGLGLAIGSLAYVKGYADGENKATAVAYCVVAVVIYLMVTYTIGQVILAM